MTMAKHLCSVLLSFCHLCSVLLFFLLLVCVCAEKSKFAKVDLSSFVWKDAEDNNNCLETSSSSVMHIQGKCSPFRLPNSTWWKAISESIKGDTHRYRAMMKGRSMASVSFASGQTINTGNYIINLGFGTPVQSFYAVLDTGSDHTWIPCTPCPNCSSGLQLFEPSKSSTYKYLTCASEQCQSLDLCDNNNNNINCSRTQSYGDGSQVDEFMSLETLSVGSELVKDYVFGCANAMSGIIQQLSTPGLVGFGRNPVSFVSQTATRYNRFSYCIPSYSSSAFTGSLLLGKEALSEPGLQFTPILSNAMYPGFYYVGLNGISVGEELVSIPAGTFSLNQSTGRGTIIDSATVITRLVEPAYNALRDSFRRQLSNLTLASPTSIFDTCYNIPYGEVEIPLITLHFDGLNMTLPKENILYPGNEEGSVLCLAFALSPGGGDNVMSIFGNYEQQKFRIVYDVTGSRLGIAPKNCDEVEAIKFDIRNQCGYTVWAAGIPGGGKQLDQGQTWTVSVPRGTQAGRFWGRTGCSFDTSGRGTCQTGDCGGLLSCEVSGAVPHTLVEYILSDQDYYDISLVDGFNVPVSINPTNPECTAPACQSDVNGVCPAELKVDGGCKSACNVFQTDQYCCRGAHVDNCSPTNYSMIFKNTCPQAYSYVKDDPSSTFTCPSGTTDYTIVFCPDYLPPRRTVTLIVTFRIIS